MSTLTVLDWPALLAIPDTRWYLDRGLGDIAVDLCVYQDDCPHPVVAFVEYRVAVSPSDPHVTGYEAADLVCSQHLPDFIDFVLHVPGCNPLVAGTVVEVGVDPALLRLTGVDPAVVARFNDGALGVAA